MGIISEIKSTYKFARNEVSRDLKRNPTTNKAIKRGKKTLKQIKSFKLKKPNLKAKKGKKLTNRKVLRGLKKKVDVKFNLKKRKFKRKKINEIRRESFGISLNI